MCNYENDDTEGKDCFSKTVNRLSFLKDNLQQDNLQKVISCIMILMQYSILVSLMIIATKRTDTRGGVNLKLYVVEPQRKQQVRVSNENYIEIISSMKMLKKLYLTQWIVVLCLVTKMQVGFGSGNFRQNRVGSVRVELGNVIKNLCNFLLWGLLNADKSAD